MSFRNVLFTDSESKVVNGSVGCLVRMAIGDWYLAAVEKRKGENVCFNNPHYYATSTHSERALARRRRVVRTSYVRIKAGLHPKICEV